MSESRYLKMKVFSAILTACFCFGLSVQISDVPNPLSNEQNTTGETLIIPNYSFDPQIVGFNSSKLTSGPIVLADKRTLFVADLHFEGIDGEIEFWAGTGSPYGSQKHMVLRRFLENPTNLYVILPENLTLDVVDFLEVKTKNESLDYVIFEKVNRSAIRNYDETNMDDTVFRIPKCCLPNQYLNDTVRDCSEAHREVTMDINIFESNETGLDPDIKLNSSNYRLMPYVQYLQCGENKRRIMVEDLHGLIYNSSLIIQGTGILSHRQYCTDVLAKDDGTSDTLTLYCYYEAPVTPDPNFYLPVLIISAICFALSAAAYGAILRPQDIHKRCFIIFSSSMCLAFICLIIMQLQSNYTACNLFGFVFIFTAVLSFLWLLILCLELLYLVIYPIEDDRYDHRWYWYCGITVGLSFLIFIISLFSGELWVADVPNSFIMNYGNNRCYFETSFARAFIVFVPIIVSIVGSIASLIAVQTFINKNEGNSMTKNDYDWVTNHNNYKFLSRTYIMIIIVACFWLLNIFFYTHQLESGKTQLALDVIKASLGLVTFIGFVGNKYTRQELKDRFSKKKKSTVTEEGLGLNGIPTPDTPVEVDPLVSRQTNNLSTFQNNRPINSG